MRQNGDPLQQFRNTGKASVILKLLLSHRSAFLSRDMALRLSLDHVVHTQAH